MVLTRQQLRKEKETSSAIEQNMPLEAMPSSEPAMSSSDREISVTDQLRVNLPRESLSWSMGDHQGLRNQTQMQNSNQEMTHAMQCMQDKVSNLEHSLQTVTEELRGVIQSFNENQIMQNTQTPPQKRKNNPRNEVSTMRRSERRNRSPQSVSSSDSDDDESEGATSNTSARVNRGFRRNPKLPPFTGKETWKVWFNRFEEVANRQKWSSEEKLDELLPRLQGVAGEFVYEQLSHETRSKYTSLCKELNNRFRVIETSKAYWVQFSHRNQKYGETVEDYAADLKKLYDKAHIRRDSETRREDLLRRFLDGLVDDKARFHVEFIKEPKDIDEAVYQVVCFQQTKQNNKSSGYNNAMSLNHAESSSDSDDKTISRAAPGKNKHRVIENKSKEATSADSNSTTEESLNLEKLRDIIRSELKSLTPNNTSTQFKEKAPQFNSRPNQQSGYRPYNNGSFQNSQYNYTRPQRGSCFLCGEYSHFKASCPQNKGKQQEAQSSNNSNNSNSNSQGLNYNGLTPKA